VIVIHSPKEEEVENLSELLTKLQDPGELIARDLFTSCVMYPTCIQKAFFQILPAKPTVSCAVGVTYCNVHQLV
jgi:hypothetical protein